MKCLTQWMLKGEVITAYPSVNSVICSLLNVSFTLKCWRRSCQTLMVSHWQHWLWNTLSSRMWWTLWQLLFARLLPVSNPPHKLKLFYVFFFFCFVFHISTPLIDRLPVQHDVAPRPVNLCVLWFLQQVLNVWCNCVFIVLFDDTHSWITPAAATGYLSTVFPAQ